MSDLEGKEALDESKETKPEVDFLDLLVAEQKNSTKVNDQRNKEEIGEDDASRLGGFTGLEAAAMEKSHPMGKLLHAERLVTVGRNVAGLAHCIKNLVNSLKAGEHIVDKGIKDNNIELLKKGYNITRQGSERIRELVLDILTISKRHEPEYKMCHPQEIVTMVLEIVEEYAKKNNVKIETKFDQTIGQVRIDRKRIFRCLMNLVSNAIDACADKGGIIQIETFRIEKGTYFGFRITDNGYGISKKNQKKLFHEFFSTKGSNGTGLGLSVAHAIVSEHDGNIRCDSKWGKGTTFTVELPTGQ